MAIFIDANRNPKFRLEGDRLLDVYTSEWVYSIRGNNIYDTYGNWKFEVRGGRIYDTAGNWLFEEDS